MITCETFRTQFQPATEDAMLLEHVRFCDACLSAVAETDPDILFRSIGGGEMLPPGGLDVFVDDVMREVRLRSTEKLSHPFSWWPRRLAVAATLTAGIVGTTFFYQRENSNPMATTVVARKAAPAFQNAALVNRPVVEQYDSEHATIVEAAADGPADVKVVMIFDEELPADL